MTAYTRFQQLAHELGHDFSGEIKIGGNYTPVMRDGHQLYVSGQIPRVGDEVLFVGAVGDAFDVAQGQQAAAICAMRALAFLRGRSYALPQDVIDLVPDVLRHRLVLSYEALSEGLTPEAIIAQILQAVPVPDKPLDSHVRTAPTAGGLARPRQPAPRPQPDPCPSKAPRRGFERA